MAQDEPRETSRNRFVCLVPTMLERDRTQDIIECTTSSYLIECGHNKMLFILGDIQTVFVVPRNATRREEVCVSVHAQFLVLLLSVANLLVDVLSENTTIQLIHIEPPGKKKIFFLVSGVMSNEFIILRSVFLLFLLSVTPSAETFFFCQRDRDFIGTNPPHNHKQIEP